jgi:predicted dithiol-disulfide oxidoreductase (DUF899 family)
MKTPGQSSEYRVARDRLLEKEIELRRAIEDVAIARRSLPQGGEVPEDYIFESADPGTIREVRLSQLFGPGKDSLVIYNFMFPRHPEDDRPRPANGGLAQLPLDQGPCPSCVAFLDQLDGAAAHVEQKMNLAVIAKAPIDQIAVIARERGRICLRVSSNRSPSKRNPRSQSLFCEQPAHVNRRQTQGHYPEARPIAGRQWDLDAATYRSASGPQNLFHKEPNH